MQTLQSNRVKLLEITGRITDDDGRFWDGAYWADENGNISFSDIVIRKNGNQNVEPEAEPQFQ
ncbi:MAG: hypothetical protein AAFN11_14925, partial [Chloroflexota bacterium]